MPANAPIKHRFKTGGTEKVFERVLHMKRPDFSGFEWSTILCLDNPEKDFHPQTCSVIPGSFKAERDPSRRGEVRRFQPNLSGDVLRLKVTSRRPVKKLDLSRSDAVVALGRGIGDAAFIASHGAKVTVTDALLAQLLLPPHSTPGNGVAPTTPTNLVASANGDGATRTDEARAGRGMVV